jgi:hypothetical protein
VAHYQNAGLHTPRYVEPADIFFDGKGGGEFACGCVTGAICGPGDSNAIEFSWDGNNEWTKLVATEGRDSARQLAQRPGLLPNSDEANFLVRPWRTSLTTC